jgi:bifunctional non-homologous end joining protein LigD
LRQHWLHEIKHDGFRVIARKAGERVKLYSRPGNDLTYRFPLIVEAVAKLRSQSCIIDGEAVACGNDGIALFDRIRYRHHDTDVFMWAFDLIELNGDDLRRDPLNVRKATLASVLARAAPGLRLNEHLEAEAQMSSITPVCWALRGSCRSGRTRATGRAARRTGSRAKTRTRPR